MHTCVCTEGEWSCPADPSSSSCVPLQTLSCLWCTEWHSHQPPRAPGGSKTDIVQHTCRVLLK